MIEHRSRSRATDRFETALARAARGIEAERVASALRILRLLAGSDLGREQSLEVLRLRAECCIAARQFATLDDLCGLLRRDARTPAEHDRIDLLEAHGRALSGRVREAVRPLVRLLRRRDAPGDERARTLMVLGLACYRTGHYVWAQGFLQDAAAHHRVHRQPAHAARVLITLALVCKSWGRLDAALGCLDEAQRLLPRRGHRKSRFRLQLNRGICFLRLGKLQEARTCFLAARSLASEREDGFLLVSVHNNLGHVYRLEGSYDVALEFHAQALRVARVDRSERQECLAREFLGETLLDAGRPAEALRELDEAHDLARRLAGRGDLMMEVLRRRGEAHAALGDPSAARADLERAVRLAAARGERRERVLAERAQVLLDGPPVEKLCAGIRSVLAELRDLGDRFEYARTVVQLLETGRATTADEPWLAEAAATAVHYFGRLGSQRWKSRLQDLVGHARRVQRSDGDGEPGREAAVRSRSPAFAATLEAVQIAARGALPVLIVGDTGVGKEVVAQWVHAASSRADGPLLAVNCGALPETLVESELFGHAQGAFTGAGKEKMGLLEAARGGSVLLDEIGDLPPHVQVKLLRFLDTGELRRVGDTRTRCADVRILACTNRDLDNLARDGAFRTDLLYRLNAFRIEVPPLSARREDILPLAEHFLRTSSESRLPLHLSAALQAWLLSHPWPGNVRELRNLCGYLSARAWGKDAIDLVDLPESLRVPRSDPIAAPAGTLAAERRQLERARIYRALRESRGSIGGAAARLGMGRNTLARRMREFGWTRAEFSG